MAANFQQVAPLQTLYDYPANRFVTEFIGEPAMNVLSVGVHEHDGRVVAVHDGVTLTLPDGSGLDAATGTDWAFGVCPEDVSIAGALPGDVETFTATVTVREPLGEQLLIHCQVGGEELRVKVPPRSEVAVGESVELSVDTARLHLFDGMSGDGFYHSTPHDDPTVKHVAAD
ncbi:ABC-type sugar transport system ATPase subunit [Halarchaeum rubridurum]|uniref:ABC-type sugar transport system ATPase subunit n=1 Tax=Halarchaeum rubridurum TaxID=489911 RepID=A0A830G5C2_9EURY|nr:TOBE domain-containing protein [Halarchaeum rubridurum]MBP1955891.1 ABC-type sugar transport system ATPase subunit [Halarchaeum rubridurum]GGM75148.1 hypothetical protein GCM10009017_26370 [Halarchaeum rubridurum]